jgi:hypothetical protein
LGIVPESVFGMDPADPACVDDPVYQELVKHELSPDAGDRICVLLTGSYFQHHFSAVFSVYRDQVTPSSIVLDVDLADRCRAPTQMVAATYAVDHVEGNPLPFVADSGSVVWRGGPLDHGVLELVADPPAVLATPVIRESSTLVRATARIDSGSFTHRLHYRWRWTS